MLSRDWYLPGRRVLGISGRHYLSSSFAVSAPWAGLANAIVSRSLDRGLSMARGEQRERERERDGGRVSQRRARYFGGAVYTLPGSPPTHKTCVAPCRSKGPPTLHRPGYRPRGPFPGCPSLVFDRRSPALSALPLISGFYQVKPQYCPRAVYIPFPFGFVPASDDSHTGLPDNIYFGIGVSTGPTTHDPFPGTSACPCRIGTALRTCKVDYYRVRFFLVVVIGQRAKLNYRVPCPGLPHSLGCPFSTLQSSLGPFRLGHA